MRKTLEIKGTIRETKNFCNGIFNILDITRDIIN
jgi:hypothetical protein